LFTLWTLTTKSGKRIDGMLLRRDGQENEVYVDASGAETKVNEKDVIDRKMRSESLMPLRACRGINRSGASRCRRVFNGEAIGRSRESSRFLRRP